MTSQIAIFNQLGIAVASDTLSGVLVPGTTRTANRKEKIYDLGSPHQIVVVHFGPVTLNDVHWRLVINEWKQSLDFRLPKVTDYAENFVSWLSRRPAIITNDSEKRAVEGLLNSYYDEVSREVLDETEWEFEHPQMFEIVEKIALKKHSELEAISNFPSVRDDDDEEAIRQLEIDLDEIIETQFSLLEGWEGTLPLLRKSAPLVLSRCRASMPFCGFAFIGFGNDEYFGNSVRMECRGVFGNTAHTTIDSPIGLASELFKVNIATISGDDSIWGYLRGANKSVTDAIYNRFESALVGESEDEDLKLQMSEFVDEIREDIKEYQSEQFLTPLVQKIAFMSLLDVADVARTFVSLEALRSVASPELTIVGGFIETLIISREYGVQWVERLPRVGQPNQ